MTAPYVGRFAPSPTGRLHFGSMVAAVASYLEARRHGGRWLLRIEDVDTPRVVPGAADDILRTLERFSLCWDGEPVWQSQRLPAYAEAFAALRARGAVFPCACSRKDLADAPLTPDGARRYPGYCRHGMPPGRDARAWRLRVQDRLLSFEDGVQGRVTENLAEAVGDFVVWRGDGIYAYQLAVVVDDAAAGVTDVVRGADLLDSTCRQRWVQHCLDVPAPRYMHVPIAVNRAGEKLSKQTLAPAADRWPAASVLQQVLIFLGQSLPAALYGAPLPELWAWALAHWDAGCIPRQARVLAPFLQDHQGG